ncbi:5'-AMP-activated protein kinase-related [Abeliophyllum distichum]|uniref:5'-AMP-activated protein kinase-related n=1 Tax=Abeliophyllum distichum TaxID=126358 RepID=A0ABD1W068_9LAMI
MVTLITTQTYVPKFPNPLLLNHRLIPSLIFVLNAKKGARNYQKAAIFSRSYGSLEVKRARSFEDNNYSSWCCGCKQGEGDVELEAEIMEFMEKSEKPTMFPSKEELVRAGRVDLVEAIKKRGGWYSLGWEDEDEKNMGDNVKEVMNFDIGEFLKRVESCKEIAVVGENYINSSSVNSSDENERLSSGNLDSGQPASSSGRVLEIGAEEDTGIQGILSRLEKQRNTDFGMDFGKYGHRTHSSSKDGRGNLHFGMLTDVDRADTGENARFTSSFPIKGVMNNSDGKITPDNQPETWRTWSIQRSGFQDTEFEAAEISFSKDRVEKNKEAVNNGITASAENIPEALDSDEEINHNQIKTRLQYLECELSTALHSLRSKREKCILDEVSGSSSSDLQKLSDAWEFQENEYMNAQERLRSIRAKLAVLEGKMALAIIDAQRIVEEKQKRIASAHKALQLLRTACIVWPNSASEVLLAGSFDGWTTQRKMEKSRTGIFSVCLKLYPGRYEIKFIVDGIWKVDPLRPIVDNNGYENNVLIIT